MIVGTLSRRGTTTENGHSPGSALTMQVSARAAATGNGSAADDKLPPEMSGRARRAIGCWLLVFGSVVLANFLWAWSTADRLNRDGASPAIRVHWLWWSFGPTAQFTLLLVVALAAMMGSVATMALVFSNRAGHRQLEERWEYWYVHRPLSAACIGLLFYVVVTAGFLGNGDTGGSRLTTAAATGALAGLFTDRVLAAMRSALGASAFNKSASDPGEAKKTGGTEVVAARAPTSR